MINNYCWKCGKEVAVVRSIVYADNFVRNVEYKCPKCHTMLDVVKEKLQ